MSVPDPATTPWVPLYGSALPARLAGSATEVADCNSALEAGWCYAKATATNVPPNTAGSWWMIQTLNLLGTDFLTQIAYAHNTYEVWRRFKLAGASWVAWERISPADDTNLPARLASQSQPVPGNDFNQAIQTGWYRASEGVANPPPTLSGNHYYYVEVIQYSPNEPWVTQIAYELFSQGAWKRNSRGDGTWNPWLQTFPINNDSLPGRLADHAWPALSDCNSATQSGWYWVSSGSANAPVSDHGKLLVSTMNVTGNNSQIWFTYTTDQIFVRRCFEGTWKPWTQIYPIDDGNLPARIADQPPSNISDCNNAIGSGWFATAGATNCPSWENGWGYLFVIDSFGGRNYRTQLYFPLGANRVSMRGMYNAAWTAWAQIYPIDDAGLPPRISKVVAACPSNDLNQAVESGWYVCYPGSANFPPGINDYCHLFVTNIGGGNVLQKCQHYNSDVTWSRESSGGVGQWRAWVNTYGPRLGQTSTPYAGDLNNCTDNGWYAFSPSTSNAPLSGYGMVQTWCLTGGDNVMQFAYQYNLGPYSPRYRRQKSDNGAWSAWVIDNIGRQSGTATLNFAVGDPSIQTINLPVAWPTTHMIFIASIWPLGTWTGLTMKAYGAVNNSQGQVAIANTSAAQNIRVDWISQGY